MQTVAAPCPRVRSPEMHVHFTVHNLVPAGDGHWIFIFGVSPPWPVVEPGLPRQ